jgi:hypothetical protein
MVRVMHFNGAARFANNLLQGGVQVLCILILCFCPFVRSVFHVRVSLRFTRSYVSSRAERCPIASNKRRQPWRRTTRDVRRTRAPLDPIRDSSMVAQPVPIIRLAPPQMRTMRAGIMTRFVFDRQVRSTSARRLPSISRAQAVHCSTPSAADASTATVHRASEEQLRG